VGIDTFILNLPRVNRHFFFILLGLRCYDNGSNTCTTQLHSNVRNETILNSRKFLKLLKELNVFAQSFNCF